MEWWLVLVMILGGVLVLMALEMPVAFAFLLINLIGAYIFFGGVPGLRMLTLQMFTSVTSFTLVPIVMFTLMGEIMFQSGMGLNIIDTADKWLGRLPGRLGVVAVIGGTVLAALSGSSMASAAILGSLLTPEMEKRGYKKSMSLGPILGSAGLAIMIPPSSLAVLLAALAGISVAGTLIGGIIPGLMMAFFYGSYIILRCYLQPSVAPTYKVTPTRLSVKVIETVKYVLPLGLVIFLVTGVIFVGIATPSEAAVTGTAGVLILAAVYKRLNWDVVMKALWGTLSVTGMIFMILAASMTFGQILSFSGATETMVQLTTGLPVAPIVVIIIMLVILLFLGMFMNTLTMIMITLPIFMPIVHTLGFNPMWFGIMVLLTMEMGVTSPPYGAVNFVMKGVAPPDTTMGDIYLAGLPFLGCDLTVLALMVAFPQMVLWLPSMVGR